VSENEPLPERIVLMPIRPDDPGAAPEWGGVATFCAALARRLDARSGPPCALLYPSAPEPEPERRAGAPRRIPVTVGDGPWAARMARFNARSAELLGARRHRILACDYWVVPPSLPSSSTLTAVVPLLPSQLAAVLLAERLPRPLVPLAVRAASVVPYLRGHRPLWAASLAAERAALRRVDRLLLPAPSMVDRTRAHCRSDARIELLPWGTPEPIAAPPERAEARRLLGLEPQAKLIVTLGRIHPQKGLVDLVRAWELLEPPAPTLALVGPVADRRLARRLERLAAGRGDARLLLPGPADQTRCALWLAAADVYASGALHEPFGLAVREALRAGVPVAGLAVDGLVEVLRPPGAIAVASQPAGDRAERLAGALRRLLERPPRPAEVAAALPARTLADAAEDALRRAWDEGDEADEAGEAGAGTEPGAPGEDAG